jgi:hypothetical protein
MSAIRRFILGKFKRYTIQMKPFYLPLCLLMILSASLAPSPAFAGDSALVQRLEALNQESLKSKPECEAFRKSVVEIMPPERQFKPLEKKSDALKLLERVKKYPGIPEPFKQALTEVNAEYFTHGELGRDVNEAMSKVYSCETMIAFEAMRVLMLSAGPLKFSMKERKDLAHTAFEKMGRDLDRGSTLITVAVYSSLLTSLVDERVIDVSDAIFTETLHWNERYIAARIRLKQAHQKTSMQIGLELELTWPLSESLGRIARRLGPA